MEAETYESLRVISEAAGNIIDILDRLKLYGLLERQFVHLHKLAISQIRAEICHAAGSRMSDRELSSASQTEKIRLDIENKLSEEANEGLNINVMKPLPPPPVKGDTPSERMSNALTAVLRVPKEVVLREEAKEKRKHERKRARRTK